MELLIVFIAVAFLAIAAALGIYVFKGSETPEEKKGASIKTPDAEMLSQFKRKAAACEEKLKSLEMDFEAASLELKQTKEREKVLLTDKSKITFDSEQYEKFKKDFQTLKVELTGKEESLEKEISERRKQGMELALIRQEHDILKKKNTETDDAYRKSQTLVETLTKELQTIKSALNEQRKIVDEHKENKIEGEWVSRPEFEKIERELREKEAMIQRLLSLKKDQ